MANRSVKGLHEGGSKNSPWVSYGISSSPVSKAYIKVMEGIQSQTTLQANEEKYETHQVPY
jgi:hypothetical protein